MGFGSGIKDIRRASHVVNVLFKHGLGYFIQKYGLKFHLPFLKKIALHKYRKPVAPEIRLRKAMEELGGAYIKLGQLLSLRPDLVPFRYCREFSKLQDKVPPFPYSKARKIIESELGKPMHRIFREFRQKPLGSASIAQVHLATLKSGKKAVVKVQRPNVREIFRADISILYYFARQLDKIKAFGKYSPIAIVEEFEKYTKNELNFLTEAENIEIYRKALKNEKIIKVPKLYREYTSSRVLTTEFIKGKKLSQLIAEKKKLSRKTMTALFRSFMKQIFEKNIFHADVHPGNVLVLNKEKVALLDYGIVGKLTPYEKKEGVKLYVALVNRDTEKVIEQLLKIGKQGPDTNVENLRSEVDYIVRRMHSAESRTVRITHILVRLFESCTNNSVTMPIDLVLFAKALLTIEGTALMIDPKFNFVEESKDYVLKYRKKKLLSAESFDKFLGRSREISEALSMIPSEALSVLEKVKQGVIKIDIEDTDLKRLAYDIDKSSNRLSYAMVMAALIVGGALLMHADSPPHLMGMSFPALVLYLIAGFVGVTLLLSILKEGAIWR